MKKIFLISYHLDAVNAGPAIRFSRYAPLFLKRGYRLTFLTRRFSEDEPLFEARKDYDVIRIATGEGFMHHTLFIARCLLRVAFSKEPQKVVLTFGLNSFQLWLMPLIRWKKVKLIYVNTMNFSTQYRNPKSMAGRWYNGIHAFLYRSMFNQIAYVVSSTAHLANNFKELGVAPNKLKVIFNGVDIQKFYRVPREEKLSIRRSLTLPEEGLLFTFVGLKIERKGILDLIASWEIYHSKFPGNYLVLVGAEKEESSAGVFNQKWKEIKADIETNGKGVILRESSPVIDEYFKASDVFVFLSKKEGMPNVLLEAMACGLPVVTTRFEGYSDVYGKDGEVLINVERSPVYVARELEKLTVDRTYYEKLSDNAISRIESHFDVEVSIGKYISLFEN